MTVTEKILARRMDLKRVRPGQIYDVPVDLLYVHDNNGPIALQQFAKLPCAGAWDPERIFFVLDHHSPATTFRAAEHHRNLRTFARSRGIRVVDVGRGVSHAVMAEEGHARPGRIIVGTDSHTVGLGAFGCLATGIGSTEAAAVMATGRIWLQVPETVKVVLGGALGPGVCAKDVALHLLRHFGPSFLNYMALEIEGPFLESITVEERQVITTMCLEMGVKNAVMPADQAVMDCLRAGHESFEVPRPDEHAGYASVLRFDVSQIEPLVARPALPTNGVSVGEVAGVEIQQATLGSCSGAFYHDLVQAEEVLRGRSVHPSVRFIVVPNSSRVMARAAHNGVLASLVEHGAIVSSPACGTCGGYEVGCLAPGEVCLSTTTRNMEGRMGPGGIIYLASARTVAASAATGRITDPRELAVESPA